MALDGTFSIFRIDATGDTEVTAQGYSTPSVVEFNTGATRPDARSRLSSAKIKQTEDISIHPNPNRHLSQIQAGKLGVQIVTLRGYFETPNSAQGIAKLLNWMVNDKTNASLPFGRFGLRSSNMGQIDLTPSATIGYVLQDFEVEDIEDVQNQATFTVVLYRNGGV